MKATKELTALMDAARQLVRYVEASSQGDEMLLSLLAETKRALREVEKRLEIEAER